MAQTHSLDLELSSSQYGSITDASQTNLDLTGGDFTIECWVKPESIGANAMLVGKDNAATSGNSRQWSLFLLNGGGIEMFYRSATSTNSFSNTDDTAIIKTGIWQHIAVSVDVSAASFIFYVNGVAVADTNVASDATSVWDGGSDVTVGANSGGGSYYDGLIKDVRIFSDIRTAAEIASDAATESVSDANLEAEWNFNNAYTDASGNSNTLTSSGSPVFSTDLPWKENSIRFGNIGPVNTSSSYTSLSVIGPEMIGIVYVVGDTSDNITAVTWGGSSMTKIAAVQTPTDRFSSAWYILDPSAGESTIAFTGGSFWRSIASYYRSAKQSGQVDSSNTGTSSASTTIAVATTVVAANSWTVMMQKDNSGSLSYTTDVGVMRANSDAGGIAISDSNGTVSTGSQTTTLTSSSSKHGAIHISIAPSALAGPANVKSWNGVAIADIKSINGLAIADIKSINGLA